MYLNIMYAFVCLSSLYGVDNNLKAENRILLYHNNVLFSKHVGLFKMDAKSRTLKFELYYHYSSGLFIHLH